MPPALVNGLLQGRLPRLVFGRRTSLVMMGPSRADAPMLDLVDRFLLNSSNPSDDQSLTFRRINGRPPSRVIYFLPWCTTFRLAYHVGLIPLDYLACYEMPPAIDAHHQAGRGAKGFCADHRASRAAYRDCSARALDAGVHGAAATVEAVRASDVPILRPASCVLCGKRGRRNPVSFRVVPLLVLLRCGGREGERAVFVRRTCGMSWSDRPAPALPRA